MKFFGYLVVLVGVGLAEKCEHNEENAQHEITGYTITQRGVKFACEAKNIQSNIPTFLCDKNNIINYIPTRIDEIFPLFAP
jgi:hypothetical protein